MPDREEQWPWLPPDAGTTGAGRGPEPLSDVLARRLLAQRVVLLHGPLDDLSVTRVSAELMTLDAEGDDAGDPARRLRRGRPGPRVDADGRDRADGGAGAGALPRAGGCGRRRRGGRLRPPGRHAEHPLLAVASRRPSCRPTCATWPSGPSCAPPSGSASAPGWARPPARRRPTVEADLERGRFLGAEEAVEYGILDEVCPTRRPGPAPARIRARRPWVSGRCADGAGRRRGRDRAGPACLRCGHDRRPGPASPPLAAGEWDDVLTRVLENSPGGTDEPMHIFTTLGRADPELFRRWLGFGGALLGGSLPGRLRELVILRTAAPLRRPLRVGPAHRAGRGARASRRPSSRPSATRRAAWTRSTGRRSSGPRCAPSTRRPTRAPSPTPPGTTLADLLRESELIELLMLIGHYLMLTTVLRSLRLPARAPGRGVGAARAGRTGGVGVDGGEGGRMTGCWPGGASR